uniref:CSON009611 protein n=1 Tax=Culicoides sonorensis TaxID=179676 RepID=A0A336M4C4_CULSO
MDENSSQSDENQSYVIEEEFLESEPESSGFLYENLEFTVFQREFRRQTSGPSVGVWKFTGNSAEDFAAQVWSKAKQYVKREVVFDDESIPAYHEDIEPIEEGGKFLLFGDSIAKIERKLPQITSEVLSLWTAPPKSKKVSKRELTILIHQYSLSVASKSLFQKVTAVLLNSLEQDRSGAASQDALNVIIEQLKEKHSYRFKAADLHWQKWANIVASSDYHQRAQLIDADPPNEIRWFFRPPDDVTLMRARNDQSISTHVNNGALNAVKLLQDRSRYSREVVLKVFDDLDQDLEILRIKLEQNEGLLSSMGQSLRPTVTEFGEQMYARIPQQQDVDHVQNEEI